MDDIILIRDNMVEMNYLKKCLAAEFEIKDLGALRYFLGMEVARLKKGGVVSQWKSIIDLLKEIEMSGYRPSNTSIDSNVKLGKVETRGLFGCFWKLFLKTVFENNFWCFEKKKLCLGTEF